MVSPLKPKKKWMSSDGDVPEGERQYIGEPLPSDILCGRGKSIQHPGNDRMRDLVMEKKNEYQDAKRRDEKTAITNDIVAQLLGGPTPVRFLLKDDKGWYSVGTNYAKEKVSHALRAKVGERKRTEEGAEGDIEKLPKKKGRKRNFKTPEHEQLADDIVKKQRVILRNLMEQAIYKKQITAAAEEGEPAAADPAEPPMEDEVEKAAADI